MAPLTGPSGALSSGERPGRRRRLAVAAIGAAVAVYSLAAWQAGQWQAVAIWQDAVPIAPSAAIFLLLLSVATMGLGHAAARPVVRWFVYGTCSAVVAGALSVICNYLAGRTTEWENLLVAVPATVRGVPIGRMSPVTATLFLLAAFGLLTRVPPLVDRRALRRVGAAASFVAATLCLVTALAYLTGTPLLYDRDLIPMSFLAAAGIGAVSVSLLLEHGLARLVGRFFYGEFSGPVTARHAAADRRWFGWTVGAVLVLGAIAGFSYLRVQQTRLRQRIAVELTTITTLKIDQVTNWREERLKDARVLLRTPLATILARYATHAEDRVLRAQVVEWLSQLTGTYGCSGVFLVDPDLHSLLTAPATPIVPTVALRDSMAHVARTRDVVMTDLYRGPRDHIHFDLIAPVFASGDGPLVAALVLQIDAQPFLFPLVQNWPTASQTAETLLLRGEGGEIVYLNELRHRHGTALSLRLPGADPHLLGAQVMRGEVAAPREALDYRGVPVVGFGRKVPATSWFLVAKIDQAELYQPLIREALLVFAATLAVLAAVALGGAALWRQRNNELLRRELAAETARKSLAERLAMVMQQASDMILVLDEKGQIVEANDSALAVYGYTLRELRSLPAGALHSAADPAGFAAELRLLDRAKGGFLETVHQRKGGACFPVEVSGRYFENDGARFRLGIYRDISERRAAELQIERLSRVYAALSQVNQAIVRVQTREELFSAICHVLVTFGKFKMAWIGWYDHAAQRIHPVASFGDADGFLSASTGGAEGQTEDDQPEEIARRESRTVVENDIAGGRAGRIWSENAVRHGFRAAIALPIRLSGEITGVLTVYADLMGTFQAREVALLEEAASDISFALDSFARAAHQQQTQAALQESEERYRSLFANMVEGFAYCRMVFEQEQPVDFVYLDVNAAFTRLTGLTNVIGRKVSEVIPGLRESDPILFERYGRVARSGAAERFEVYVQALKMWFEIAVYSPQPGCFVSVFDVVTARKEAEEALRLAHERLLRFVNANIVGIVIADSGGRIFEANDYYLRLIGFTREEFQQGKVDWRALTPPEWLAVEDRMLAQLRDHGTCPPYEKEYRRADGTRVPVLLAIARLPGPTEQMAGFVLDLTERRKAEQRIREQAALLDKANEAIVVLDLDNRITFWSRGAERLLGWTSAEALGKSVEQMFALRAVTRRADVLEALAALDDWRGELPVHDRNGRPLTMEMSITVLRDENGRPQGRLSISADISEQKKLEERFLRAQRLESIGMLAAGVAHDLNNVLAPIGMAATLLREQITTGSSLGLLDTLDKCSARGAGLVRQILGFVHGIGGEIQVIQARHMLNDVAAMLMETLPKSITVVREISNDLWTVRMNPTHLHQVLLNLCVNARDAMPTGGTLLLRAENIDLDEAAARQLEGARAGSWVVLQVQDSGSGIDPDVLGRIWEPFFTTKTPDKGTGLGLATVRGIVETHQGFITLETAPGRGTTFRVYLPAIKAPVAEVAGGAVEVVGQGQGELILVVDDEAAVRQMVTQILHRYGYRVRAANDGAEASQLFLELASEVALVITDWEMPATNGAGLISAIRAQDPGMKILVISGLGSNQGVAEAASAGHLTAFLAKPFTVDSLMGAVRRLLSTTA